MTEGVRPVCVLSFRTYKMNRILLKMISYKFFKVFLVLYRFKCLRLRVERA